MPEITKLGLQVVAISYDSVEVLEKFGKKAEISYPLLSDSKSEVIDRYKIRNREANERINGVPHPGTFLIDREGKIRAKLGREGYRKRHDAQELIDEAKKLDLAPTPAE